MSNQTHEETTPRQTKPKGKFMSILFWIRMKHEINQSELAKYIRLSASGISRVEQNERHLRLDDYVDMCQKLEIDPGLTLNDWLLNKDVFQWGEEK